MGHAGAGLGRNTQQTRGAPGVPVPCHSARRRRRRQDGPPAFPRPRRRRGRRNPRHRQRIRSHGRLTRGRAGGGTLRTERHPPPRDDEPAAQVATGTCSSCGDRLRPAAERRIGCDGAGRAIGCCRGSYALRRVPGGWTRPHRTTHVRRAAARRKVAKRLPVVGVTRGSLGAQARLLQTLMVRERGQCTPEREWRNGQKRGLFWFGCRERTGPECWSCLAKPANRLTHEYMNTRSSTQCTEITIRDYLGLACPRRPGSGRFRDVRH